MSHNGANVQHMENISDAYNSSLPDDDNSGEDKNNVGNEDGSVSDAMLSSHCDQGMEETVEDTMTNIGMFCVTEAEESNLGPQQIDDVSTDTSAVDRLAQDLASLPPFTGMSFNSSDSSNLDNTAAALGTLSNMVNNSEMQSMSLASQLHEMNESENQLSSADVNGQMSDDTQTQEVENSTEANSPTEDRDSEVSATNLDSKYCCEAKPIFCIFI